ncbi:hypothetical protein EX30DRAFT_162973 [Ascodesmis nigricans]|uniref:NWD NACHT-NTPase N-terminal domain-containing protein n=1 Tax=Ascodesmis nigricans TaxID=341454 RepID=A0A4S2MMK0_9PEZI|nr:hypothetical protein EX30DRAFT_162973 [Ascodesmis nigricans]
MPFSCSLKLRRRFKGLRDRKKSDPTATVLCSKENPRESLMPVESIESSSQQSPLPAAPSAPASQPPTDRNDYDSNANQWKKAIEKAEEKLKDAEKEILLRFPSNISLAEVIVCAENVFSEAKSNQWKHMDKVHSVLESLETFANIGDIFIQNSPEATSLIWGSFHNNPHKPHCYWQNWKYWKERAECQLFLL